MEHGISKGGENTTEKIGSDVLNAQERSERQMEEKRKKEMLQKLAEEKSKRMSDELDGKKVPKSEIPGNHVHERKAGEGYDLINVRAHRRSSPRRQKKEE